MGADERAEKTVVIQNELGLHARAATKFVQIASKFSDCEIMIAKDGPEVNGKSILSVLTLVAPKGTRVTLRAQGDRASEAVSALVALIDSKFGEGK